MVINSLLAFSLVLTGSLILWAHGKVAQRQVVRIDGSTSINDENGATSPSAGTNESSPDLVAKNFLLTGSDNGACPDKGDGTLGGIGDRTAFGERSDTIMVLRVDPRSSKVMVLSFPRDLWVDIAGTTRQARINSAFDSKDPTRLIRTINDNFGVPIDHYVNVNLCAFKEIVDSVGGVKVPFLYRTKDERSGLREVGPGCIELRGSQALAYVRSRSGYRYFSDTKQSWLSDPTGDIGRINRQQDFLRRSMQRALDRGTSNPATANALLNVALNRVITDDRLTPRDLLNLAQAMQNLNTNGVNSYTVEWSMRRIGEESVLIPVIDTDSMKQILSIFRGEATITDPMTEDATPSTNDPIEDAASNTTIDTTSVERRFAFLWPSPLLTILMSDVATNDDSSSTTVPAVSPRQERLGVFPPDDPACR